MQFKKHHFILGRTAAFFRRKVLGMVCWACCLGPTVCLAALEPQPTDTARLAAAHQQAFQLRMSSPDSAMALMRPWIPLLEQAEPSENITQYLNTLGIVGYLTGDFESSLHTFLKVYDYFVLLGNDSAAAHALNGVGVCLSATGEADAALRAHRKSLDFAHAQADTLLMVKNLLNLGVAMKSLENYDSARHYFSLTHALANAFGDLRFRAQAQNLLGEAHFKLGNFTQALASHEAVLADSQYQRNWENCFAYAGMAQSLAALGRQTEGVGMAQKGLQLAQMIGAKWEVVRSSRILSEIYAALDMHPEAYQALLIHKQMSDSVYNEATKRDSNRLRLAREEARSEQLEVQSLEQAQELERKSLLNKAITAVLLIFSVLVMVLFYSYFQQKRLYLMLREQKEALERQKLRLENQKAVLDEQHDVLGRVSADKDKVFSIISHDLRGPVASLSSMLALVDAKLMRQEEFMAVLPKVRKSVDGLFHTLTNLLRWSQSQMGGLQVKPEPLDVVRAMQEVHDLLRPQAEEKYIDVVWQAPKEIQALADREHVQVIFRNLLTNALKFSGYRGEVKICFVQLGQQVQVSIEDSGRGCSANALKAIAGRQGHFSTPGTAGEKGTGLGLSICQDLLQANQGRLLAENVPNKGAKFTVVLPLAQALVDY